MRTLTVGGGGREHAFMHEFARTDGIEQFSTQGNAGMDSLGENLGVSAVDDIVAEARRNGIDFVAVGPEAPLIDGLADKLRSENIPTLGFGAAAAQLEGSKAYATEFAEQEGILIPKSHVARSLYDAIKYSLSNDASEYVIKADGQAGGKGVILPETNEEAASVIDKMMLGQLFGGAGRTIVFQERLHGPEVSMFALFDGTKAKVLFMAQDHKRLKDNDEGPNTGGMGAYCPVPETIVSESQKEKMYVALEKTMIGMQKRGINSPGVLYFGFMLAEEYGGEPALMEYNARFGDPEAEVVLPLLSEAGYSVHDLFYAASRGELDGGDIEVIGHAGRSALTVCLAADGYPDSPEKGITIHGLKGDYEDVIIHHAATKVEPKTDRIITAGGRVLYVTALGHSIKKAANRAYGVIGEDENGKGIYFEGMQLRNDIGHQAIKT